MNIRLVGSELIHADGRTDRHIEANCRFSKFCERASKKNLTGQYRARLGVTAIFHKVYQIMTLHVRQFLPFFYYFLFLSFK
jgi:hypothetical protein